MAWLIEILSLLGVNGILLFFIKRYFSKRDKAEAQEREERRQFYQKIETGLETIKLLSYHRMSQETERLLSQGFATPAERAVLQEMYENYKAHGWNGDMDARLAKVYQLRTDRK